MKKAATLAFLTAVFIFVTMLQGAKAQSFCFDSDYGKNIFIAGYVELTSIVNGTPIKSVYQDACVADYAVNEYSCANNTFTIVVSDVIACPTGYFCGRGACIKATTTSSTTTITTSTTSTTTVKPSCFDSDGGLNALTPGYVQTANGSLYFDYCATNIIVNEYYCANNNVAYSFLDCPANYRCSGGACISTTTTVTTTTTSTSTSTTILFNSEFRSPAACNGEWIQCHEAFNDNLDFAKTRARRDVNKSGAWSSYSFNLPENATVGNVVIIADFFSNSLFGNINVRISGDNGLSFGPSHIVDGSLLETRHKIDVGNDIAWTAGSVNNIVVEVECFKSGLLSGSWCYLDWLPVNVVYH